MSHVSRPCSSRIFQWPTFIFLILFSLSCFADNSLLNKDKSQTSLNTLVEYFDDPTQSLTIKDITSAQYATRFTQNQSSKDLIASQQTTKWIRFDISSPLDTTQYLLIDNIFLLDLQAVDVFLSAKNILPIPRNPQHTFPVFKIDLHADVAQSIYIKVKNPSHYLIDLPIKLLNEETFQQKIKHDYILYGGILFGFITLILYNFFLFLSVREKSYLLLIGLFVSSILLLNRSTNTLDFLSMFRDPNAYFFSLPFALFLIFDIAFWKQAINLKISHPKANTFFNGLIAFNVVCIPFLGLSQVFELILFFESFLLFTLIPGYTISVARSENTIAQLYLPGLLVSLLTILPIVLAGLGLIIATSFIIETYMVGIFLFGLSLSLIQVFHMRELRRKKEQAEAMNIAKDTFLASMNHELRTPMHSIMSAIDLLDTSQLSNKQKMYVEKLTLSSRHMLDLISDILNLSKEGKQLEKLRNTPFSLDTLLSNIETLLEDSVRKKGLILNISNNSDINEQQLIGDRTRLKQVLLNLLQNAIKFTHEGHVSLNIERLNHDNDKAQLLFSVSDTGIGIDKDQQKVLFEPFFQVYQGLNRQYSGTGLGLTISQKIVRLMGGKIQIESQKDKGSRFYFDLGFTLKEPQKTAKTLVPKAIHSKHSHILLVDDDEINLLLVSELLTKNGWQVTTVNRGSKALNALDENTIDLVLMDISMPDMDGYETTHRIRKQQKLKHLPIIALTAHTLNGEKERCLAAGMNDYLNKPFEISHLNDTINLWLRTAVQTKGRE